MIAYLDTSALVPLLIAEPGTSAVRALWESSSRHLSSRLAVPESRAALARASRVGRLDRSTLRTAVAEADRVIDLLDLVEVSPAIATHAGELALHLGLRGCDAVHLASAMALADGDLVMAAGDRELLEAALQVGLQVAAVG